MTSYIFRRLLLILPTLFGIILINFVLVQFVPGGPIEQIISQLQGQGDVFENISSGSLETTNTNFSEPNNRTNNLSEKYLGSRGLPEDFILDLEKQFGFDKPPIERFFNMLWSYICFDFGESYFRSISVIDLVIEKLPVSISLGLWTTLLARGLGVGPGTFWAQKLAPKNMESLRVWDPNGWFGEQKGENAPKGIRKRLDRPLSPQPNPPKMFSREKSQTRKPPGPSLAPLW